MSQKIIRDPLYNYVAIDRDNDRWLLALLDTPEVQRLRRIHQLGVSHLTYPGAEHSRLSHSLGVLHLMQIALAQFPAADPQVREARNRLLAAALLHDVGHGPFSHLLEKCLDEERDHEAWTCRILSSPDMRVHQILRGIDPLLPQAVAALVDKKNNDYPRWQKSLLSSQLDVDRLDYLRRDSLFTGASYGHYDWYRLLHSMQFSGSLDALRDLVWDAKAELAIEEYIFSRYYMYWNVYLHKTTRGFEQTLRALFRHARRLHLEGTNIELLTPFKNFWNAADPTVRQYLAIEECTVLQQVHVWADGTVQGLKDLAKRFLHREPWARIDAPMTGNPLEGDADGEWEAALRRLIAGHTECNPPELYCLRDTVSAKYLEPYVPEKEGGEQEVGNAIRVMQDGQPVEISELRPRLKPVTTKPHPVLRYFVPRELKAEAERLRSQFVARV